MSATDAPPKLIDVAIAGGGPVGLTLALGLKARGFDIAVIDAAPPRVPSSKPDARAFFVAHGCWRIWRALGMEAAILPHAEPVHSVEAKGDGQRDGVAFLDSDLASGDADHGPLGYMIAAGDLIAALEAATRSANIPIIALARAEDIVVTSDGVMLRAGDSTIRARLLAGCEGQSSAVRTAAGIRYEGRGYEAKALSTLLQLDAPHHGAARQLFLADGPLAVLPMPGNRANLVWSERADVADALVAMSDANFEAELRHRAGAFIGGFKLAAPRAAFPLRSFIAERFHAPRIALAGDSAHVIHPLAGQGLNLGLKDVAALVDVIDEAARVGLDIGSEAALQAYTTWRRADVVAQASAMQAFAFTFTGPRPLRALAGLGLQAAGGVAPLRKLFAREAGGNLGDLPTLMRA